MTPCPFANKLPKPRNRTCVKCTAAGEECKWLMAHAPYVKPPRKKVEHPKVKEHLQTLPFNYHRLKRELSKPGTWNKFMQMLSKRGGKQIHERAILNACAGNNGRELRDTRRLSETG